MASTILLLFLTAEKIHFIVNGSMYIYSTDYILMATKAVESPHSHRYKQLKNFKTFMIAWFPARSRTIGSCSCE